MNAKAWAPLALAVGLGLVAAFMASKMVKKEDGGIQQPTNTVAVLVAKKPLEPGHKLQPDDVMVTQIRADAAPEAAISDPSEIVGRVTALRLVKGQQIVEGVLTPDGAGTGLAAVIPPGMRAITLEVNEFSSVARLLNPGCRVDVLATFQGSDGETISRTIVQNVKVTAVGQRMSDQPQPEEGAFGSVTLLVKPADAEKIELACTIGRPRLILRSGLDNKPAAAPGITLAELRQKSDESTQADPITALLKLGMERALKNKKDASDPFASDGAPSTQPSDASVEIRSVKIIRGGQESQVNFEVPKKQDVPGLLTATDARETH
jgi:pilus assembly protein CpaB